MQHNSQCMCVCAVGICAFATVGEHWLLAALKCNQRRKQQKIYFKTTKKTKQKCKLTVTLHMSTTCCMLVVVVCVYTSELGILQQFATSALHALYTYVWLCVEVCVYAL